MPLKLILITALLAASPATVTLNDTPTYGSTITFTVSGLRPKWHDPKVAVWCAQGGQWVYVRERLVIDGTATFELVDIDPPYWDTAQPTDCSAIPFNERQGQRSTEIIGESLEFEVN